MPAGIRTLNLQPIVQLGTIFGCPIIRWYKIIDQMGSGVGTEMGEGAADSQYIIAFVTLSFKLDL